MQISYPGIPRVRSVGLLSLYTHSLIIIGIGIHFDTVNTLVMYFPIFICNREDIEWYDQQRSHFPKTIPAHSEQTQFCCNVCRYKIAQSHHIMIKLILHSKPYALYCCNMLWIISSHKLVHLTKNLILIRDRNCMFSPQLRKGSRSQSFLEPICELIIPHKQILCNLDIWIYLVTIAVLPNLSQDAARLVTKW